MRKTVSKRNGRRKRRAAPGAGRLYKRSGGKEYPADSPVNAPYWIAYTVPNPAGGRGKQIRQALRNQDGRAITDRKAAEAERKRIVAPYQTGSTVETLKAVQARLQDAEAQHVQAVDQADPPLRIKDAWQAYDAAKLDRPESGPETMRQYKGHWDRFERWMNATHPEKEYLRDVSLAVAREYANDLLDSVSAARFNKHVRFLDLLFRILSTPAKLTGNPWQNPKTTKGEGIQRRQHRSHSRRELTIAELTTVLDRADGDLGTLLLLGAATGLRLGDCCTLEWGDVDLSRGIIRRIPNKTAKSGKPVLLGIPPRLHERLAETPTRKRTGYVLPDLAERYKRDVALVTNAVRDHLLDCGLDVHAPGTGSRIVRDADGLPERDADGKVITKPTGKTAVVDVGFHSLRHTWVSMHAAAGTPGAIVQASVGHANPAMTQHYLHVGEDTARDVARALPTFAGNGNGEAREPLPQWAVELIEKLPNTKAVKPIKAALLKGGAA